MKAPENKRFHRALFLAAYSAATAILLPSSYSDAAEWSVVRRVNLIETYSDNVRLGEVPERMISLLRSTRV